MNEFITNQASCKLCRYSLSDVCGECKEEKFRNFQPRENFDLWSLPDFPLDDFNNGMPVRARQVITGMYITAIVKALKGE